MNGRAVAALFGLVSVGVFAGCYASTEPATDVGPDSAKLTARGTANNGPAVSVFEYWLTGSSAEHRSTDPQQWANGASGAWSQKATHLADESQYSFRVCGADQGSASTCAQTRTFSTLQAVEDSAWGGYQAGCCAQLHVDATSGPSGEEAHGSMTMRQEPPFTPGFEFHGFVTCLIVHGRSAAVGAVGESRGLNPNTDFGPASLTVGIVDGQLDPDKTTPESRGPASPHPDCAAVDFSGLRNAGQFSEFIVNDAPASTPTSAR